MWYPIGQSETMRTFKDPSRKSLRAKTANWVIFKGDNSLDAPFSWLLNRLKLFWIFHMSGYLMNRSDTMKTSKEMSGDSSLDAFFVR